jgi:succinate dehydrogenase/fumarate reductase cytochrome b subunit
MTRSKAKLLHRLSGIVIAVFFASHVLNHICGIISPQTHVHAMNLLRIVYRSPPIEILLLLCITFQIGSGIYLVANAIKDGISKKRPIGTVRIFQSLSGLYLALFLGHHVRAVMYGRFIWNVETDYFFAASGIKDPSSFPFFFPYYTLSLLSAFLHIACAHYSRSLETSVTPAAINIRRSVKKQAIAIVLVGFAITSIVMLGLMGVQIIN